MPVSTELEGRTATAGDAGRDQAVTLINCFVVSPEKDDAFMALWTETSAYFRRQPGFLSLHFHRALSPSAEYRYVNVARWATLADFQAAHDTEEFRRVVGQDAWRAYPSNPNLYEVVASSDAEPTAARS